MKMVNSNGMQQYAGKVFVMLLMMTVLVESCSYQLQTSPMASDAHTNTASEFVVRSGSQLLLNGQSLRFAGSNIYWLGLDDDANYPSQFRVDDGLDAAKEMGATVIRSHTLGISTGCTNCIEPKLGVFNQTAFSHHDYAIKAAKDRGLRLIIPLVDNWHYIMGGKYKFTAWRGISDENKFYSDRTVIGDFETYIKTLLNHVNTYTGIAYKDDPTIMTWETGNELNATTSWTQTISTYIKSIDHNHLVLDGRTGIDPQEASLTNVDMVSDHYYPKDITMLKNDVRAAKSVAKVFYVGEFDWDDANGGNSLSSFLSTIESDPAIIGDAFWDLWSHDDHYGYISGDKYTLHFPGDTSAMRASVQLLRAHAYKMSGESVPPYSIPGVPVIDKVIRGTTGNTLTWRGTALADSYTVERSTASANGPWMVICDRCVKDTNLPWIDTTAPSKSVWYRVRAYNLSAVSSKPSAPFLQK